VPAARPDDERRQRLVQAVRLALRADEREFAADGRSQRLLAADDVRPGRRERVLEIGHEDASARIEGVDHHLRLGRTGDLYPPIVEVLRCRGDGPLGGAHVGGCDRKVRQDARIQLLLPLLASLEKRDALAPEPTLQPGDEREGIRCEDLVGSGDGAGDFDAGPSRCCHPLILALSRSAPR
jgi:hypothetical protein